MTDDERNLLMLLARIVASGLRKPSPTDQELNEAIRRIEDAESRKRDEFVKNFLYTDLGIHGSGTQPAKYFRQQLNEGKPDV